tara:strand:- start:276 stop:614 length:339 start_codon:yes stop_codon:yes gene_type:complete
MKNLESKHTRNDKWLNEINLDSVKKLVTETPNDAELGEKVRMLFINEPKKSIVNTLKNNLPKHEDNNIFGKISGAKYKELITGYQEKNGTEFTDWYDNLTKEEKIFLSDLFD